MNAEAAVANTEAQIHPLRAKYRPEVPSFVSIDIVTMYSHWRGFCQAGSFEGGGATYLAMVL